MTNEFQDRCYQCFRPKPLCFCKAIPRIQNRTDVLILQHIGERFHAFNTARIVHKALDHCHLIVDHNRRLATRPLPIRPGAGLLYPHANARPLDDLSVDERPSQLVIIDGTWHQAKTIVRDVPQLQKLPCYRLAPSSPGRYRIRREPNVQSLSTLEATVAALQALEPETAGLDQLLSAFNTMVDDQLRRSNDHAAWRQKGDRNSRPRHIPPVLLQEPDRLVIAYGESTPRRAGKHTIAPSPLSWVATRLGTAESFSCRIRQQQPIPEAVLAHMRLSAADFDDAVSETAFRHRWSQFLRRNDILVVYHQRTCGLLKNIGASLPRCLVLKSVFGKLQDDFHSMEELMAAEEVELPSHREASRAIERLDIAVALVERLRERYSASNAPSP